jgi:hypothetical protein
MKFTRLQRLYMKRIGMEEGEFEGIAAVCEGLNQRDVAELISVLKTVSHDYLCATIAMQMLASLGRDTALETACRLANIAEKVKTIGPYEIEG